MAHLKLVPPITAARAALDDLRAQGAEICVVLCHEGFDGRAADCAGLVEQLARLDGVAAIVMGHRHGVFPGGPPEDETEDARGVRNSVDGQIAGVPAVMPGFRGQHVGCIDLSLVHDPQMGWRIRDGTATVHAVGDGASRTDLDRDLREVTDRAHRRARRAAQRVLGHIPRASVSYFARLGRDPGTMLVARVMQDVVHRAMPGLDPARLIGLAGPAHAGWPPGRDAYAVLAAGDLRLAQLVNLHPFPDRICAVRMSGADLLGLFARSAAGFHWMRADLPSRPIVNEATPGLELSMGPDVSVTLDLGRALPSERVISVLVHGQPVQRDAEYVVAMSYFRAFGGRGLPGCEERGVLWTSLATVQRELMRRGPRLISDDLWRPCYDLRWPAGAQPLFVTARQALGHMGLLADLGPAPAAITDASGVAVTLQCAPG